jgi:hypothetical protein
MVMLMMTVVMTMSGSGNFSFTCGAADYATITAAQLKHCAAGQTACDSVVVYLLDSSEVEIRDANQWPPVASVNHLLDGFVVVVTDGVAAANLIEDGQVGVRHATPESIRP